MQIPFADLSTSSGHCPFLVVTGGSNGDCNGDYVVTEVTVQRDGDRRQVYRHKEKDR